jgi:hypothetical protein
MIIRVQTDGSVLLIHQTHTVEAIATALNGTVSTKRASHVEPVLTGSNFDSPTQFPSWNVDLRPIQGPASLTTFFANREAALQAEVQWIEANVLNQRAEAN